MVLHNENTQEKQAYRFFFQLIAGGVSIHLILAALVALQIG